MLFPSNPELILWLEITTCLKRTVCLSLQNIPHLFMMQGFLSRRCSTAWGKKMKSPVNQKYCFFLFTLAFKICNKEAKTTLSFEYGATGQNWIPSISNIHWLNTIFHSNNFCITLYIYISPQLNIYFQAILMALLKKDLVVYVAWCA